MEIKDGDDLAIAPLDYARIADIAVAAFSHSTISFSRILSSSQFECAGDCDSYCDHPATRPPSFDSKSLLAEWKQQIRQVTRTTVREEIFG